MQEKNENSAASCIGKLFIFTQHVTIFLDIWSIFLLIYFIWIYFLMYVCKYEMPERKFAYFIQTPFICIRFILVYGISLQFFAKLVCHLILIWMFMVIYIMYTSFRSDEEVQTTHAVFFMILKFNHSCTVVSKWMNHLNSGQNIKIK